MMFTRRGRRSGQGMVTRYAVREMIGACYHCGAPSRYKHYRYCETCYTTVYALAKKPSEKPKFVVRVCLECEQEFNARVHHVEQGKGLYCSQSCRSKRCNRLRKAAA